MRNTVQSDLGTSDRARRRLPGLLVSLAIILAGASAALASQFPGSCDEPPWRCYPYCGDPDCNSACGNDPQNNPRGPCNANCSQAACNPLCGNNPDCHQSCCPCNPECDGRWADVSVIPDLTWAGGVVEVTVCTTENMTLGWYTLSGSGGYFTSDDGHPCPQYYFPPDRIYAPLALCDPPDPLCFDADGGGIELQPSTISGPWSFATEPEHLPGPWEAASVTLSALDYSFTYSTRIFAAIGLDLDTGLDEPHESADPGLCVGVNDDFDEQKVLIQDREDADPCRLFSIPQDVQTDDLIPIRIDIAGSNITELCGELYDRVFVSLYTSQPMPADPFVRIYAVKDNGGLQDDEWHEVLRTDNALDYDPNAGWQLYVEGRWPTRVYLHAEGIIDNDPYRRRFDTTIVTVVQIDADVDSDNTNNIAPYGPDAADPLTEDRIEEQPGLPGRLVLLNDDDDDQDGILDHEDGYNKNGDTDPNMDADDRTYLDATHKEDDFVMLKVKIAPSTIKLDPNKAWVRVGGYPYLSPDPDVTNGSGSTGRIRLWKKPGDEARDRRNARPDDNGPSETGGPGEGDWVAPGEYKDLRQLMPVNLTATHEMTFYIEGVQASQALGDARITFELDPDGEGTATGYVHMDTVQVTVYRCDFLGLWETTNPANRVFNHTWKDDPADNCKEVDPRLEPGPVVGNYGTWRQMLYIAEIAPEQGPLFYSADLDLDVQPIALRGSFRCAVYDPTSVKLCDTFLPSSTLFPAWLMFSDPVVGSPKVTNFPVKAGYDANANGVLDNSEASPIVVFYAPPAAPDANQPRYATIKGINNAQCMAADTSIIEGIDPPITLHMFRHARSFLSIFYFGNLGTIHPLVTPTPSLTTPVSWNAFTDDTQFSEWLSHNCGTNFDSFGQATATQQYTWDETSVVSQYFAGATPFRLTNKFQRPYVPGTPIFIYEMTQTCQKLKDYYDNYVKAEEIATLKDSDPGTTHPSRWCHFPNEHSDLFTSTNGPGNPPPPSWVAPATQDIGHAVDYSGGWVAALHAVIEGGEAVADHDAALAVGRGRVIDPQYSFTTRKVDNSGNYYVDSVQFVCILADLYDFNLECNLPASDAAAVQIGYGKGGNGRSHGIIFFNVIQVDYTYIKPFNPEDY